MIDCIIPLDNCKNNGNVSNVKNELNFINSEVSIVRGAGARFLIRSLIFFMVFVSLLVLVVRSVMGEASFERGFCFILLLILPLLFGGLMKTVVELLRYRYSWETTQPDED